MDWWALTTPTPQLGLGDHGGMSLVSTGPSDFDAWVPLFHLLKKEAWFSAWLGRGSCPAPAGTEEFWLGNKDKVLLYGHSTKPLVFSPLNSRFQRYLEPLIPKSLWGPVAWTSLLLSFCQRKLFQFLSIVIQLPLTFQLPVFCCFCFLFVLVCLCLK